MRFLFVCGVGVGGVGLVDEAEVGGDLNAMRLLAESVRVVDLRREYIVECIWIGGGFVLEEYAGHC